MFIFHCLSAGQIVFICEIADEHVNEKRTSNNAVRTKA